VNAPVEEAGTPPESAQPLPSAFEAVATASDAEEAFSALRDWSRSAASLTAPARAVERELLRGGFEVLRRLLEENLRGRGLGDVAPALGLREADGTEVRLGYRREHECEYESYFGTITVRRLGYGAPGQESIHPLDEELSLPARRYSQVVQQRAALLAGRGPFGEAHSELEATTAAHIPLRQVEEVVKDMAVDFDGYYEERSSQLPAPEETGPIIVVGVDCKGIPRRKTEEELSKTPKRLGKGEKRTKKRMATVASVHTAQPQVRTAEEVVSNLMDAEDRGREKKPHPRPEDRRLWASVKKSKDEVFAEMGQEIGRRNPKGDKTVVCVTDGEEALRTRAVKYLQALFWGLILVLDIIHVLEYLWKAAYVFEEEGSEEARQWVRKRLLRILRGEVVGVVAGMRQMATKRKLTAEEREPVDKACGYFLNNKGRMRYDKYLSLGLPIASGTAEGACGHLVRDRMERTGAIWDVDGDGAEAVLKIRALDKSGDYDDYCEYHAKKEHDRLYEKEWRLAA
jgi:hypothetical protein